MLEQGFRRVAEEARERWNVPALALGVSLDGRHETLALGCEPETRFHVASVTKPFTATLVARLLDLDAPAGTWPGATVRHLLSHTAGYDCELGDLRRFGTADDALPRLVSELGGVRRWTDPGVVWSYSNAGYWLAGQLAADAVGTSYEAALLGLVCEPAGLTATDFDRPDLGGHDADARTGEATPNGNGPYPRARRPSGGLVSNVPDLLRFGEWRLAEPALTTLLTPIARRPGGSYGLGFMCDLVGGHAVWHHGGDWGGFQSTLVLLPEQGLVLAGLSNSRTGAQVLRAVRDEVLGQVLGVRPERPATVPRPDGELEALAGRYAHPDAEIDVAVADGWLEVAEVDGDGPGVPVRGRPLADGEFEVVEGPSTGSRFDFPLPGFGRFSSRLAQRL